MRLLACTVMLFCSLALVKSFPLEETNNAAIQTVTKPTLEKELVRDKRTIGVLRELFPNFSQIIDRKIQMLTRLIFRLVGRLVLNGGNNQRDGDGGSDSGTSVKVVLPTYPTSEDDDDDDEDDEDSTPSGDTDSSGSQPATTTVDPSRSDDENKVEGAKERKKRQAIDVGVKADAAAADNNEVSEESNLDDDEDRDKRFLNFNGGASSTANAAGSGNFLFDVIRLVAGSGNTEEGDEASNTPLEGAGSEHHETSKGYDGLGIPGPLTRLFVVANRGVASLIQDLILRLAQTSEKLVNFKARLITSII